MIEEVAGMAVPEAPKQIENGADEHEEPRGFRVLHTGIQYRSTRDLEECISAELHESIDPELLESVRRLAKSKTRPEQNAQK